MKAFDQSGGGSKKTNRMHEKLWEICRLSPMDYEPYGEQTREIDGGWGGDCSCGCEHYLVLEGKLGADWGVCTNPLSHRCGLLTFEHQGCPHYRCREDEGGGQDSEKSGDTQTFIS